MTGLLRWLAEFQSQGPWSARRLVAEPREDGSIAFELVEAGESGEYRTKGAFTAVEGQQFVALQGVMASRKNGTWRRVEPVVTSQGSGDARFDYGDDQAGSEEEVDATGPPPLAPKMVRLPGPDDLVQLSPAEGGARAQGLVLADLGHLDRAERVLLTAMRGRLEPTLARCGQRTTRSRPLLAGRTAGV